MLLALLTVVSVGSTASAALGPGLPAHSRGATAQMRCARAVDRAAGARSNANPYTYVNGNPVNLSDPNGHEPKACFGDGYCRGSGDATNAAAAVAATTKAQAPYVERLHREAAAVRTFNQAHSAWTDIRTDYMHVNKGDCGDDPTTCRLALWYDSWLQRIEHHSAEVGLDALNPLEQSALHEKDVFDASADGGAAEDGTVDLIISTVATLGISGTYSLLRGTAAAAVSALGGGAVRGVGEAGLADVEQATIGSVDRGLVDGIRGSTPTVARAADSVRVFRGTSITSELQIHEETGLLMSDAARVGYVEGGGSVSVARTASEVAHAEGVNAWGSESAYIEAHGAFGTELSQVGLRSMISVTTDPAVAKYFAGPAGQVFSALIPRSSLLAQTLDGAGESEYLVRYMFGAQ